MNRFVKMDGQISVGLVKVDHFQWWPRIFRSEETETRTDPSI